MSPSGLFSWVSEGSPRGDYVWSATASDPGGLQDTNVTLTVNAMQVPEPSTIVLALTGACNSANATTEIEREHANAALLRNHCAVTLAPRSLCRAAFSCAAGRIAGMKYPDSILCEHSARFVCFHALRIY